MNFRVSGLSPEPFRHLFGLSDEELRKHRALRYTANKSPGFPDRIQLRDAKPGETVLLVNHMHQAAETPYRSGHAIFVLEGATEAYEGMEIPEAMRVRPLSLRAFDASHMMVDADLVDGREAEVLIERLFADPKAAYIHVHYAKRGCYAARIDRA